MCDLPVEIVDEEKIVRAIADPWHIKKGKPMELRPAAFRSKRGTDEVSVMRHVHLQTHGCRAKAREILHAAYVGLAVIRAADIRRLGSNVIDSRSEYCGHAHIEHGFIEPIEEPLPPEQLEALDDRLRALVNVCTYHRDPNRSADHWTGPAL